MKTYITPIPLSLLIVLACAVLPSYSQTPTPPPWTDFTYTDWNPGVLPAITGADRHYENRSIWDGTQFVSIHEVSYFAEPPYNSYWIAYSADGQTWGTPTPLS